MFGLGLIQKQITISCPWLDAAEGLFHIVYTDIKLAPLCRKRI